VECCYKAYAIEFRRNFSALSRLINRAKVRIREVNKREREMTSN